MTESPWRQRTPLMVAAIDVQADGCIVLVLRGDPDAHVEAVRIEELVREELEAIN